MRRSFNPLLAGVLRFIEAGAEHGAAATPPPSPATVAAQTTPKSEPATGDADGDQGESPTEAGLSEAGKKAIKAERAARRTAEERVRELEAELAAQKNQEPATGSTQRNQEPATGAAPEAATAAGADEDLRAKLRTAEQENWRHRALADHAIPRELVELLAGESEEEVRARAALLSRHVTAAPLDPVPKSGVQTDASLLGSIAEYRRRIVKPNS